MASKPAFAASLAASGLCAAMAIAGRCTSSLARSALAIVVFAAIRRVSLCIAYRSTEANCALLISPGIDHANVQPLEVANIACGKVGTMSENDAGDECVANFL